ncbi:hypothetical protein BHYA_0291g00060 [Botrytis hyacinthi]|uniref:N-acetyltransferase domain-containing protein n=1 Tax=Botrytis hyacinthi TaxID=278943 RepID=A0A4Z1GBC6_9HELO|nr:hypothetical protein BHYA_0291g00060 [Botrytis hyacinthi]
MIRQSMTPRSLWMHGRNAAYYPGLYMMVVHPEHRSCGVGGLMMEWPNTRIDKMGIKGFIEANELGRHLYEKWGYRVVTKLDLFIPFNKSVLWNKLAHELKMPPWYASKFNQSAYRSKTPQRPESPLANVKLLTTLLFSVETA